MSKAKLADFKIERDENDKPKPKELETSTVGTIAIKPPTIRDLEEMRDMADKDDEDASVDRVITKLQELIMEPDLSSVSKEELKTEYDFVILRNTLNDIMAHIQGRPDLPGVETKN